MEITEFKNAELLTEFKRRFNKSALYGCEVSKLLGIIGKESIEEYLKQIKPCATWKPVTNKDQVSKGTKLKIIGINPKDSIKCITVKKVIPHHGVEIILKKKENLYFNLGAYFGEVETVGRWVRELYYQESIEG